MAILFMKKLTNLGLVQEIEAPVVSFGLEKSHSMKI
tara:strand:+ start:294 stop:401 length:108 start_codon:yes stop_codon:yes gene_type:complete